MQRWRSAILVALVAALVRVLAWQELSGSAMLHLERWNVTDMHFFHNWATAVSDGDVLLRNGFLPDNSALVCAVHDVKDEWYRSCDETYVAETWESWVGKGAYWQDPLYPYLMAATYRLWGEPDARVVLVLQAVLGVLAALLAYGIGARLFGESSGLAAGLVAALLGTGVYYETMLLRSALLGFGALLCSWLLLRALAQPSARLRPLLAGVSAGAFALVSTTTIGFVVLALPVMVASLRRGWLSVPRAPVALFLTLYLGGCVLGFSPLIARNIAVGAPPLRSAVTAPLNFINGNGPGSSPRGGFVRNPHAPQILAQAGWNFGAVVRATIATYEHWTQWASLVVGKLVAFWHWYELPNNANYYYFQRHIPLTASLLLGWPVLLALASVGLVFGMRRSPALLLPMAWVVSTATVCAIFFNLSRLRLPAAMALTPLAGHGLVVLIVAVRSLALRRLVAALALAALVAVLSLSPWEPTFGLIRTDFYNAFNRLALELSEEAMTRGDLDAALTIVDKQLRTEPDPLRDVPRGAELGLDSWMATGAGSFAKLYRRAAELHARRGETDLAAHATQRAEVLETVVQEWRSAPRRSAPAPADSPARAVTR